MDKQELQRIARNIWWLSFILALWLAATTGYMAYVAASDYSTFTRYIVAFAAIMALDFYTVPMLQTAIRGWWSGEVRRALGTWLLLVISVIALARFGGTTTLTFWSREPMAQAITGDLETDKETAAIQKAMQDKSGLVASLEKEKNALRRSERVRIAESEKAGKALINEAINSEGDNVARLYREGNGWVMKDRRFKKYRQRISEAKKQAAALVEAEKARTQEAAGAYLTAAAGKNVAAETIARVLDQKATRHEKVQNTYSLSLGLLDISAGVIVLLLSFFLAGFKVKHNIEYVSPFAVAFSKVGEKASADSLSEVEAAGAAVWGLFFLPFQTLRKIISFFLALGKAGIYAIETRFRIDIDGDNVIGKPSDKVAEKIDDVSDKPATKGEIREIGFRRIAATTTSDKPATKPDLSAIVGVTATTSDSDKYTPGFVAEKIVGDASDKPATKPDRKIKPATKKPATKPAASDKDLKRIADATRAAYNRMKEKEAEILKEGGTPKENSAYRRKQTTYEVNYRAAVDAGHTVTFEKGKIIIVAPERGKK